MKALEKLKGWTFDYHSGKNLFAVIHRSIAVYDGKDYHVLFKSKGIKYPGQVLFNADGTLLWITTCENWVYGLDLNSWEYRYKFRLIPEKKYKNFEIENIFLSTSGRWLYFSAFALGVGLVVSYDLVSGETKTLDSDEENNFTLIHCASDKMHMISTESMGFSGDLQTLLSAQQYILSEEQTFEIMKLNFERTSEYCIFCAHEISEDMRYLLCEVMKKRRIALVVLDLKNEEILNGDELPNEIGEPRFHRYDKEHNAFIYIGIKNVYAAFVCEALQTMIKDWEGGITLSGNRQKKV